MANISFLEYNHNNNNNPSPKKGRKRPTMYGGRGRQKNINKFCMPPAKNEAAVAAEL